MKSLKDGDRDAVSTRIELSSLAMPSPGPIPPPKSPSRNDDTSPDAFTGENPMRAAKQTSSNLPTTHGKIYTHFMAVILALALYLFHIPLGPMSLKVYPPFDYDKNDTGCILETKESIFTFTSYLQSFCSLWVATTVVYYTCVCTMPSVQSSSFKNWAIAFNFGLVPMAFLLWAVSVPSGQELPACSPLTVFDNATDLLDPAPCQHYARADATFWFSFCNVEQDDIFVDKSILESYNLALEDFTSVTETMTSILKVVAPLEEYAIVYPVIQYAICNYIVFRPCDPKCRPYKPCASSPGSIVNETYSNLREDVKDSTRVKEITADLQGDRCSILVDLMDEWSGGNLRNAIPVMNVEPGVEDLIFMLLDAMQNACSEMFPAVMQGVDPITPSPSDCILGNENVYKRVDFETDGDCNPATWLKNRIMRDLEAKNYAKLSSLHLKHEKFLQEQWIKTHSLGVGCAYGSVFLFCCLLAFREQRRHSPTTVLPSWREDCRPAMDQRLRFVRYFSCCRPFLY